MTEDAINTETTHVVTSTPEDTSAKSVETTPSVEENKQATPEDLTPTDQTNEATTESETPEWFMKDKYKSIEEQAKSAFELQKKMGKYWGAPAENYQVEGIEGLEGIAKDDPLVANLMPALKEMGLSQDGFTNLVKQYQDANIKMMKGFEEQLKTELTTKDAATYNAVDKWMQENLTKEERAQVQNNWLMSAADFKLFNQLRLMAAPSTSVPSSTAASTARFESSKEVENDKIKYRKEVSQKLRVPDKNYENELASRYRDSIAREIRAKERM